MKLIAHPGAILKGSTRIPGDKSISHRAVMFGAMARGVTEIRGLLTGEDCLATIRAFGSMGVRITMEGGYCRVEGNGMEFGEPDIMDVGNSGTTMRLMTGILAGAGIFAVLTGDASIRRRPMGRVVQPLREMGAHIHGRKSDTLAPLAIVPSDLHGIAYNSPVASAQVKSAVLLAGLRASGETSVAEPLQSRDHTERMLGTFGVRVEKSADGLTSRIRGGQIPQGAQVVVPGDISSAAFPIAAALIATGSEVELAGVGTNPTRAGILKVLEGWGACIGVSGEGSGAEPSGDIRVSSKVLDVSGFGGVIIPSLIDEIPILAFLAAFSRGSAEIRDASELRVKESDRVATVAGALRKGGASVRELPDGLVVEGMGPNWNFRGGEYESHGDHRLAMSLCVAALRADGPVIIRDAECVQTSFPGFVTLMNSLSQDKEWISAVQD